MVVGNVTSMYRVPVMTSCYAGNVGCEYGYNMSLSLGKAMIFKRTLRDSLKTE